MGKGAAAFFISLGVVYLGIGIASEINLKGYKNRGEQETYAYYRSKGINILTWPKILFSLNYAEQKEFEKKYRESQKRMNAEYYVPTNKRNLSSEDSRKISEIERKVRDGEIQIEQAERMIQQIGDAYLGSGKTKAIMEIQYQQSRGQISETEAARKIINEVPTGLPPQIDKFVKETGFKYGTQTLEGK